MAIGTDELPSQDVLKKITGVNGVQEVAFLALP